MNSEIRFLQVGDLVWIGERWPRKAKGRVKRVARVTDTLLILEEDFGNRYYRLDGRQVGMKGVYNAWHVNGKATAADLLTQKAKEAAEKVERDRRARLEEDQNEMRQQIQVLLLGQDYAEVDRESGTIGITVTGLTLQQAKKLAAIITAAK